LSITFVSDVECRLPWVYGFGELIVLITAVWAAHWGAEWSGEPLKNCDRSGGLSQVAGAAFMGLAAAIPEMASGRYIRLTAVAERF